MKINKVILVVVVSAVFLVPASLYALVGTAVRRITNYSPKKTMVLDSNGKLFKQGGAAVNMYGVLVPTQTDYHKKNDPEIKQSEKTPANIYIYTQAMYNDAVEKAGVASLFKAYGDDHYAHAVLSPSYSLSDYDWRIWLMSGGKRSNTVVYDKQDLKKKYKQYRIDAAKKTLSAIAEGAKGVATGTMPNIDVGGLVDIANKPETKDVRLYIMPDSSIIFTPDYGDEGETAPEMILKDLVAKYKGDSNQDYRFLYTYVMDELLKEAAYQDALEDALEGLN